MSKKFRFILFHFSALLGCAAIGCALDTPAQEAAMQPTVEVTASRVAETVDASLADVSIITRKDIDASNAPDLIDLLRLQAGVDLYAHRRRRRTDQRVSARHQCQSCARADRRRARGLGQYRCVRVREPATRCGRAHRDRARSARELLGFGRDRRRDPDFHAQARRRASRRELRQLSQRRWQRGLRRAFGCGRLQRAGRRAPCRRVFGDESSASAMARTIRTASTTPTTTACRTTMSSLRAIIMFGTQTLIAPACSAARARKVSTTAPIDGISHTLDQAIGANLEGAVSAVWSATPVGRHARARISPRPRSSTHSVPRANSCRGPTTSRCPPTQHLVAGFDFNHDRGVSVDDSGFGAPYDVSRDNSGVFAGWRVADGSVRQRTGRPLRPQRPVRQRVFRIDRRRLQSGRRPAPHRKLRHCVPCADLERTLLAGLRRLLRRQSDARSRTFAQRRNRPRLAASTTATVSSAHAFTTRVHDLIDFSGGSTVPGDQYRSGRDRRPRTDACLAQRRLDLDQHAHPAEPARHRYRYATTAPSKAEILQPARSSLERTRTCRHRIRRQRHAAPTLAM